MKNPLPELFGAAIRKARGKKKLEDVATAADMSKGSLSDIEHGRRAIDLNTLWRIASALHLEVIVKFRRKKHGLPEFKKEKQ